MLCNNLFHQTLVRMPSRIRAAERWRAVKVTDFERRQMGQLRQELDQEYEAANGLVKNHINRCHTKENFQHKLDLTSASGRAL